MPLTFFSNSIGDGTRAELSTTMGESLFVDEGATLYSTNGLYAVNGTGEGQTAMIHGNLLSTFNPTMRLTGEGSTIFISDTGSVSNTRANGGGSALFMSGESASLTNDGTVSGHIGVTLYAQGTSLINTGTISSIATEMIPGSASHAVRTISLKALESDQINTITNHGTLSSNFYAIDADENINGANATARMTTHVTNTGDIIGDIALGGFDDELHNSGYIDGEITMGDDDDLYVGEEGFVEYGNNIYLGSGDDKAEGGDGRERVYDGSGDDEVDLGAGNDYVRAGGGADEYIGGEGKDYISYYDSSNGIRINLRDDEISGSWGNNDTISGFESASGSRTGDDRMLGTDGANTLQSYGGDDALFGRGGNDKLRGGDGEDYFDGGAGTDLLWGGDDEDVFHFDHGEGKDIIKDFENNDDTIELDNFGLSKTQAFALADEVGDNVIFDFGDGDILIVENASIAQLQNDLDVV